jgi:hypothetical protein
MGRSAAGPARARRGHPARSRRRRDARRARVAREARAAPRSAVAHDLARRPGGDRVGVGGAVSVVGRSVRGDGAGTGSRVVGGLDRLPGAAPDAGVVRRHAGAPPVDDVGAGSRRGVEEGGRGRGGRAGAVASAGARGTGPRRTGGGCGAAGGVRRGARAFARHAAEGARPFSGAVAGGAAARARPFSGAFAGGAAARARPFSEA